MSNSSAPKPGLPTWTSPAHRERVLNIRPIAPPPPPAPAKA